MSADWSWVCRQIVSVAVFQGPLDVLVCVGRQRVVLTTTKLSLIFYLN